MMNERYFLACKLCLGQKWKGVGHWYPPLQHGHGKPIIRYHWST